MSFLPTMTPVKARWRRARWNAPGPRITWHFLKEPSAITLELFLSRRCRVIAAESVMAMGAAKKSKLVDLRAAKQALDLAP
jgi:hypothetical protein